jgi:hypothetical protein
MKHTSSLALDTTMRGPVVLVGEFKKVLEVSTLDP